MLSQQLKEFSELDLNFELDFDIEAVRFETAEIDFVIEGFDSEVEPEEDQADEPACVPDGPRVTRLGDLWLLGQHWVLCADARDEDAYSLLLQKERSDMGFTERDERDFDQERDHQRTNSPQHERSYSSGIAGQPRAEFRCMKGLGSSNA